MLHKQLLLTLTGCLLASLALASPSTPSSPQSFTVPPVTSVTFSFSGTNPLQHWRFSGEWTWRQRFAIPNLGDIWTLEMVSAKYSGREENFGASPGVYLVGGQSYTLYHRRDAEVAFTYYTIGYSPVQDGTNVTNITSLTMLEADNYQTVYQHTFTPPATGIYHIVFKQTPFRNNEQPRDRFADVRLEGPGVVFAPVANINSAPEWSRDLKMVAASTIGMGLQLTSLTDPANALSRVEYWATPTSTTGSAALKLGESTLPPSYSVVWPSLPVGTHQVRARLLNADGQGAFSATPLSLTVLPHTLSATSYLGGAGLDEVRAMTYLPDGSLVMAANLTTNPPGPAPTYLNGATVASVGALLRFSGDGRQLLGMVRVAVQVVDLATDAQGRLYVAAGLDGAMRLSTDLTTVEWRQTYPGQYAHRIDAGPLGNAVVLVATDTNPDATNIQSNVRIHAYDPLGTLRFSTGGVAQNTTDVALDEASQTVIGVGHTNFNTRDPGGSSFPVFVPSIRGYSYTGVQKYLTYGWSADNTSPRWINRSDNNMADAKAARASIGKDGKLYILFDVDGGNHCMRYDPFDIMLRVRIVGGDEYFNFSNTNAESKTFIGRYEPGTGAYLLGQELTARIGARNNPGNRIGNSINCVNGNVTADAEGRVFVAAASAFGPPLNVDHLPGVYTGGAYAIVLSPDMARREAAFRIALDQGRAIAAINGQTWAYGGTTISPEFYAVNTPQPALNGGRDGFYAVTGGVSPTVALPTVAISAPLNITTTATPTLTGTAPAGAVVTVRGPVSSTAGGVLNGVVSLTVSPTAGPTGVWSTTAVRFLAGPTSVTAVASNASGTSGPAVASFTVVGTLPQPTVTISRPVNLTTSPTPELRGTATPGAVVRIDVPASATTGTGIGQPISVTASWMGHWAVSAVPYVFAPGPNSLTATAISSVGTSLTPAVASFRVVSGQLAPGLTIGAPANTTSISQPTIRGTASAFARLTLQSTGPGAPLSLTADVSGNWSTSALTFPVGPHSLTVTALNAVGSATLVTTRTTTFTVTSTQAVPPPTVSITQPANVTALSQPTLTGFVTSGASLTISGPGSATGSPVVLPNVATGVWATAGIRFPAGLNTYTVTASNGGGVASASASFTVGVPARQGPTVGITSPLNVSTVATVLLSGFATPGASVTVAVPTSATATGPLTLTANTNGNWLTPPVRFAAGINSFTAVASNADGRSGVATGTFTVVAQGCASMMTVRAGNWTDPAVWSCARLPLSTDAVLLRHPVSVPPATAVNALRIQYQATPLLRLGERSAVDTR
jgi:hypothetical protein